MYGRINKRAVFLNPMIPLHQKPILCLLKTTQYEHYKSNGLWKKLSPERKSCLLKEYQQHRLFIDQFKKTIRKLGLNVTFTKKAADINKKYTMIMTIGGDGTFLDAAQYSWDIPLLGLNSNYQENKKLGSVGALTSINHTNLWERLKKIKDNVYHLHKAARLSVTINGGKVKQTAINDIFMGNEKSYKSSDISVIWNKKKERFNCSGMIICSPIGSKAWYRNAGGKPFSDNELAFLIRDPNIDRQPAFHKGVAQKLMIYPNTHNHILSFDSQENIIKLQPTDKIEVKLGKEIVTIIRF